MVSMRVDDTCSIQTICQIPVVLGYQMECGSNFQSCLPRGLARSAGSSSARTTSSWVPGRSTSVTSATKGVYPPWCSQTRVPFTQTVAL